MENSFIIHTETEEQENALKAFVKALKLKIEATGNNSYNPDFVEKVKESREQYKKGKYKAIKTNDLWK